MAISKSRLGRGLGNLIAGGISKGAKPQPAVSKPSPAPAKKAAGATAAGKSKPAAKPVGSKVQATKANTAKGKPAPARAATSTAKSPLKNKAGATGKQATKAKPQAIKKPQPAKAPAQTKPVKTRPSAAPQAAATASTSATKATPQAATGTPLKTGSTTTATQVSASPAATPLTDTSRTASVVAAHAPASTAAQSTPPAGSAQGSVNPPSPSTAQPSPRAEISTSPSTAQAAATQTNATQAGATAAPARAPAPAATATASTQAQPTSTTLPVSATSTGATSPYREISVAAIVPNPYQPRRDMDPEHIAELANSIASEGLLQPIVVRPVDGGKSYELIAGERRWRAHQKLGLKTIAARVMDASDSSSAVISLIENIQRQALNPIEEALGFASLMRDFDLTQEAVSERIGRARASIANALRLLGLDREIQGYVAKGILSVGHAKILLGLEEPAQRLLVARRIIESSMSVRETEVLVKRLKNDRHARPTSGGASGISEADRTAIADLEKQLSSRLNTRVQLRHTPKKGRIVIEYYGNEDLQRILEHTGLQL